MAKYEVRSVGKSTLGALLWILRFSVFAVSVLITGLYFCFNALPTHAIAKESTTTVTFVEDVMTISDMMPGTFEKSPNSTVTVETDNYTGYSMSVRSATNSTSLTDGNNHEITSINSAVSESTFSTDSTYYNKWGYKPSQYISSSGGVDTVISNSNYLPAPSVSGDLLAKTSAANITADTYILSFATKVDTTLPAGTYTYTYVLMIVPNAITFNITYDDNTVDTVSNMPSPNPAEINLDGGTPTLESYVTLSDAVPVRNDKKFAGWCDVATTTDVTSGDDVCSGNLYRAGDNFPVDQTAGPNITLYAVWVETLFPIVWNQMGACEFHGATNGNITGSECTDYHNVRFIDTGIALYSQANYQKDYEIHFTIDHYLPTEQVNYYGSEDNSQQTFVNDKLSTTAGDGKAPGIVVRRNGTNIEVNSKLSDTHESESLNYTHVQDVSVFRLDNVIYYSINNGPLIMLQDISGFNQQFNLTTWFGGYPKDDCTGDNGPCTDVKRIPEATLSNMYIKLGEYSDDDVHEISFKTNDGTSTVEATYLIKDGNSITTLPSAPVYTDHLFQGWFTASSGGTQVTAATVPDSSADYFAQWLSTVALANITNDSITLDPNDTETIIVTNSAELEPYTFTSNNTSVATVNANTGEITAVGPGSTTITMTGTTSGATKTISVTVTGVTYTVSFDAQGGSSVSAIPVGEGTSINPLPTTIRQGFNFMGWFTGTNGTGTQLTTSTIFDANTPTQYYAYWIEAIYVCKIATTLHTETCSRTDNNGCRKYNLYAYDAPITYGTIPDSTTRSPGFAYTCDVNADNVFDEATERFYYLGTNNNNNSAVLYYYQNIRNVTEHYDPAVVDLPDSTVWTNSSLVAQANNKVSRFMNYDEALSVCGGSSSGLLDHTCEYLLEESNFANMNTRQDGIWMTKVNDTSSGGRRIHTASLGFGNVNPNSDGSNNAPRPVIEVPLNKIEEYSPIIKHEITFNPQNEGQSSTSTIEVEDGDAISSDMPANPSYTNHLFQRWYDTSTGNTVDASTVPTGDMTVYAEWKGTVALAQVASNSVTVIEGGTTTFQITNVSDLETFTCSSSDATVASVNASTCVITGVAEGIATISITGTTSGVTNSNIVTVTVLDPSTLHRVTFDPRNGGSTFFEDIAPGAAIGAKMPQDPTYTGYLFMRWYDVANDNTVTNATVPVANMTVYAEWKLDVTHAVISNNDLTLAAGDQITIGVSNAAQLEPYTFSSADTSIATVDANTGVITGVSAGTTNIIMTGTRSNLTKTIEVDVTAAPATMWTVTFNANGGTTPTPHSSIEVEDGEPVGSLPTTTRANYRFFGWYKDDGTFYQEVYPEEVITSDVTFYARWIEDTTSYPIVFSEINACTFGGQNVNISGTYCTQPKNKSYIDSAIALYTSTNYGKDYEIGFTIVDFNFGNIQQMTLLASKYENQAAGWPGLAIRRSNKTDYMEFTQTISGTKASNTSNVASSIHRVKIIRESGVVRFSINDGPMTQLQNMNNLTEQDFSSTVWFGASATDSNTPQRELVGTLTDMYVRLGAQTEYVINFNPNDGTLAAGEESKTINVGAQIGQLPTPTPPNANYTFDAWYDESVTPAVAITSSTIPNSNKTYVAHYTYQSSNTPVVFDVSNDATRGYQTLIDGWAQSPVNITTFNEASPINNSTWGDTNELSELDFWNGIRSNFINNECLIPSSSDAVKPLSALSAWTSGSVDCSKPDAYDTKINAALTVRLNNAQGAQVAYAKADNGVIHNMIPGQTYYWEKSDDSTIYGYVTATSNKGTRWVDTGTIRNVRDLGGLPVTYTNSNNQTVTGTVAYGRLFRGEKLNSAPATELTNLGITTEYNVGDEYSSDTHLSDYHLNQVIHYNFDYNSGDENDPNSNYMKAWTAVTNIMTDITNANTTKNVYFHCRVGADRTGTVAYLLEGLLGVPDEMRYQEYALTNVSGLYDRTRYYKQKASNNAQKFVFMMGFVETTQDIYNWYMHNPNASVNLIQAFRTAMTDVSSITPQNSPQNGLNIGSLSPNSIDSGESVSGVTSQSGQDGYSDPLGVYESRAGNNSSSNTGLVVAAVGVAATGAVSYALTKRGDNDA